MQNKDGQFLILDLKKLDNLPGIGDVKPKILFPTMYSKIKSNNIMIKIIIHVENTNCFNLLLEFSKKILRDSANKINLKKNQTLLINCFQSLY